MHTRGGVSLMTPKQLLDSFSATLMRDERILCAQERALVATLLQHARTASGENQETQEAVRAVIASAVGETVAQRAFAVLGGSIVERILDSGTMPLADSIVARATDIFAGPKSPSRPQTPGKAPQPPGGPMRTPGEPQPPSQGPHPPGVKAPHKAPQPPSGPMRTPGEPQPPSQGPHPPSLIRTTVTSETSAAVAERPYILPAQCVILDEFLAPQELEELTCFTIAHEGDFSASEVVSPSADGGIVNYEHRRSRVLMDLAHHRGVMLARIKTVLPQVLDELGMEEFSIADVEAQVTASNDGDFFP